MTTDPHGWPDPARPGVPLHPERDGWHWLHHKEDLRPIPAMWNAALAGWTCGTLHSPGGIVDLGYTYLGPALLPAEVAAQRHEQADEFADFLAGITPEERATLAGLRDGTLVAVPRRPTLAMKDAGARPIPLDNGRYDIAHDVWCAMLAAAPEAPGRGDKP